MSAIKHTPGPWIADKDFHIDCPIWTADGKECVATVWGSEAGMTESRAALIAAAPTVLEALKGVTRILDSFSMTIQLGKTQAERLSAAKAAIAKAEGRS